MFKSGGNKKQTYNIYVKTLITSYKIELDLSCTVAELKQLIAVRTDKANNGKGIPVKKQILSVMGRVFWSDTYTLSRNDFKESNVVYVLPPSRDPSKDSIVIKLDGTISTLEKEESAFHAASRASISGFTDNGSMPKINVEHLGEPVIDNFATVTTVLGPRADISQDSASTSGWPRASEAYYVYTRRAFDGRVLTGIITHGLSKPCQNFLFDAGIGIEILLEAPALQARFEGPDGQVTDASISDSWMFRMVYEIAHHCFRLGSQIRQLLEKFQMLPVEIADVGLPLEYVDPETGCCSVLLGHLGDPHVPHSFDVIIPNQHRQKISQSVLFVPACLLTHAQSLVARKDGGKKIADELVKKESFSVCELPIDKAEEQRRLVIAGGSLLAIARLVVREAMPGVLTLRGSVVTEAEVKSTIAPLPASHVKFKK